jgi:LysR family transcriptional regulator, glycine cleavage system transcriptional activator
MPALLRAPSTMSLLCLEASARLQSFTAAAQELRLTQGAVSRQIIALETRLDTKLFVRKRDALVLTEAGRYYLGEIAPLLQRLERATANVMALKGRGGLLTLSVGASLGSYWLIPRLPGFTRAHSEITLNFATRVGSVDFAETSTGANVDASLEFGAGQRAHLKNEFVLPLLLSPYAAPAWIATHGKTLSSRTPPASLVHHSTVLDAWQAWFAMQGIEIDAAQQGPRYELMSMALNAAVAGLGVVLLPAFMAQDALATGRLRQLSKQQWRAARGYYLVYPPESAELTPLKVFRDWLMEQAASERV